MIRIGRNIRDDIPYSEEVEFSRKNNFDLIQVWYDRDGFLVNCEHEYKLEFIKICNYPVIIHAMLDINEICKHSEILIDAAKQLHNKDIIIHPICENNDINEGTVQKLSKEIKKALKLFKDNGINLHLENNSRRTPIFSDAQEIINILKSNPDLNILIDLAHVENVQQLKEIVNVKFPKIIHIADRRFSVTHEHLPIGKGELDFKYIFSEIIPSFNGTLILEITKDNQSIIESKNKLKDIMQNI